MKKSLLLFGLLLNFHSVFADKGCFDVDKINKKTGKKIQYSSYDMMMGYISIEMGNEDTQSYFKLTYQNATNVISTVNQGKDTLYLKLENRKVVKLVPREDNMGGRIYGGSSGKIPYTIYNPVYYLTKEDIVQLAESPLKSFKFMVSKKAIDFSIPDRKGEKIMKGFVCLLQTK